MQEGPFGEKFFSRKKSRSAEKNERGESLVSPGMVCYAEKQEKPFWFSSLDQIVHFDAIIFCRTFVELFWSVRVDRKKRVTIIVAFHFMKRRLKTSLLCAEHRYQSIKYLNVLIFNFHWCFKGNVRRIKNTSFLFSVLSTFLNFSGSFRLIGFCYNFLIYFLCQKRSKLTNNRTFSLQKRNLLCYTCKLNKINLLSKIF